MVFGIKCSVSKDLTFSSEPLRPQYSQKVEDAPYKRLVSVNRHPSFTILSYDVASGSEITPCNKIVKPLVVYRFTGNVMTSIITLRS